jgi:hypothetical protein
LSEQSHLHPEYFKISMVATFNVVKSKSSLMSETVFFGSLFLPLGEVQGAKRISTSPGHDSEITEAWLDHL